MVKQMKGESSQMQTDYAITRFATGMPKRKAALQVGYSNAVALSAKQKIETRSGYDVAIAKIARDSNSLALAAMDEFKRRGFKDFTNKDLVGALNAIGSAWSKFNGVHQKEASRQPGYDSGKNPLRTLVLQSVQNQILNAEIVPKEEMEKRKEEKEAPVNSEDLGF